jgi:hypothetical protein
MLHKQVLSKRRAQKAESPAKSVLVTATAASVRRAAIALNKASVKSVQYGKHLLPKKRAKASPAGLTLPQKQKRQSSVLLQQHKHKHKHKHRHQHQRHPLLLRCKSGLRLLWLLRQWPCRHPFRLLHRLKR